MKKPPFTLPPVGQFSSRNEWVEACWKKILKSGKLFESLVTPYERRNVVMRAAATDCVNSGKGVRQIARELHISLQTINSVKRTINENKYRSYRERGKTERKKREYSSNNRQVKIRPHGRPVRTKYGTIYLP